MEKQKKVFLNNACKEKYGPYLLVSLPCVFMLDASNSADLLRAVDVENSMS